jgi:hypothetical protein
VENENNLILPKVPAEATNLLDAVVSQILTNLWHELKDKRNLILGKLHEELPIEDDDIEIPRGYVSIFYKKQLVLMANEYASIMDSINDIIVIAGSKNST